MAVRSHYQPLRQDRTKDTFRLFDLQPGKPGEPITGQLRIAEVPDNGHANATDPYEAVSYTWGPKHPRFPILLGAWPFLVRKNLWDFLRRIRHPTETLTLWIDAICINQSDLEERAYQVSLMSSVFTGAQHVLVWLGKAESYSHAAMHIIKEIAEQRRGGRITENEMWSLFRWSMKDYWSRTWVVQEFLLAFDLVILCGKWKLPWNRLRAFMLRVNGNLLRTPGWSKAAPPMFNMSPAYALLEQRANESSVTAPLLTLLERNSQSLSRDPRDKIYAMLGIATDCRDQKRISTSYTKDLRLLLFQVIELCAPAAKDLMRIVEFLMERLEIRPLLQNGIGLQALKTKAFLTVDGFRTGMIVYSDLLDGQIGVSAGLLSAAVQKPSFQAVFKRIINPLNDGPKLRELEHCGPRLHLDHGVLDAISRRTWPDTQAYEPGQAGPGHASQYLIAVLTSHCHLRTILIGIASGSPRKGDAVIHFAGHEDAMVVRDRMTGFSQPRIVGRAICAADISSRAARDKSILESRSLFTIQNETDCTEPQIRIAFRVEPTEMLMLTR